MFFKMYDWVMFGDYTMNEMKLFSVIATYTDLNGEAYLSYSQIEKFMSRRFIKKTLDSLIDKGMIKKTSESKYKSLCGEFDLPSVQSDTSLQKYTSVQSDTEVVYKCKLNQCTNVNSTSVQSETQKESLRLLKNLKEEKNTLVEPSETFLPLGGEVPASYFESGMKTRPYDFVLQEDWDRWDITNKAALLRGEFGDIKEAYEWINENNVKR